MDEPNYLSLIMSVLKSGQLFPIENKETCDKRRKAKIDTNSVCG